MITANQLILKVVELAISKPDFVYVSTLPSGICVYVAKDDTPACIFGQALADLGVDFSGIDHSGRRIDQICISLDIDLTPDQRGWMVRIQRNQDGQMPWGQCLASATEYYPNVVNNAIYSYRETDTESDTQPT